MKTPNHGRHSLYEILRHYYMDRAIEHVQRILELVCGPLSRPGDDEERRVYEHGFKSSKATFLEILRAVHDARHAFDGSPYRVLVVDYLSLYAARQQCTGQSHLSIVPGRRGEFPPWSSIGRHDIVIVLGFDLWNDLRVGQAYEFLERHLGTGLTEAAKDHTLPLFVLVRALRVPWPPRKLSSPYDRIFEVISSKER